MKINQLFLQTYDPDNEKNFFLTLFDLNWVSLMKVKEGWLNLIVQYSEVVIKRTGVEVTLPNRILALWTGVVV